MMVFEGAFDNSRKPDASWFDLDKQPTGSYYHFTTALAQVRPAPKATRRT